MFLRKLTFALVALAWAAPSGAVPGRITDGLVGEWHLDRILPLVNRVDDTSGNGHHGKVTGGSSTSSYGWYNKGLDLRTQRYVTVNSPGNLNVGTGSFTIAAWVKISTTGSFLKAIVENRGNDGRGYHFAIMNGQHLLLQLADETGFTNYTSEGGQTLSLNRWHHVAVTVDRTTWPVAIQFWIDGFNTGNIFTPRMGNLDNTSKPFYIGAHKDWTSAYFNDRIDEVFVYGRGLETWELWTVMYPGHPQYTPSYWNGSRRTSNNCYNYATSKATGTFAQPGRAHGITFTQAQVSCAVVTAAAIADGYEPISWFPSYVLDFKSGSALVVAQAVDYHWYRMEEDGTWSHKPGSTSATNLDNSGNVIYDPQTADRGIYTEFCGFFRNWSDISDGYGHEQVN